MKQFVVGLLLVLPAASAIAGIPPPNPAPEPGTLALIAGAVAAGLFITRNRRK